MEGGGEAGARLLRDGSVAELYGKFDEGRPAESDRSDDGDDDFVVERIDRQDGEDRRIHRSRLSQSLTNPCETLISCSFRTRKDGRTSGECAQHLRITCDSSSGLICDFVHETHDREREGLVYLVYFLEARLGSFQDDSPLYPLDDFRVLQATIRHLAAREYFPHKYPVCPYI